MSWPENNPNLHELRRKWDEGHFRQDADSVYGIDEAVDEAIEHISMYDIEEHNGLSYFGRSWERNVGIDMPTHGEKLNNFLSQELAKGMFDDIERQVGEKTCRICCLTATNDPCDTCYSRWRRASQTPSEAGFCVFCRNKSPSVICVTCVKRVLKDGLK